MAPSFCIDLDVDEQIQLLAIARRSIESGLAGGQALQLDPAELGENLWINSAVFITLTRGGNLRGCIGSLQPSAPLAQAVANSSFDAAFRDQRFACLREDELLDLEIEISVLSAMEPIEAADRAGLLQNLLPGEDGLLLEDSGHRATFLPKVWDKLATPDEFVEQLLLKAGLSAQHWSETIRFYRYRTLCFGEH